MKRNNLKMTMFLLSLAALLIALVIKNSTVSAIMIAALACVSLLLLYRNMEALTGVEKNTPNAKTLKQASAITISLIAVAIVVAVIVNTVPLSAKVNKYLSVFTTALLIITIGNIAPKLPRNKYTGIRLPWITSDDRAWTVAHRLLGYLSFPLTAAYLVIMNFYDDMEQIGTLSVIIIGL